MDSRPQTGLSMERPSPVFTGIVLLGVGILTLILNEFIFNDPLVGIVWICHVIAGVEIASIHSVLEKDGIESNDR